MIENQLIINILKPILIKFGLTTTNFLLHSNYYLSETHIPPPILSIPCKNIKLINKLSNNNF